MQLVITANLFTISKLYAVCPPDDNPCQFDQECEDFGDFKMCFCDNELYEGEFCEIISK